MIVKIGFNTDFGRDKFDVGLDETDLARILTEAGIPPDSQLTAREVFQVLASEASRFCAAQRAMMDADKEHWVTEAHRCGEQLSALLGKITVRLGLEPDQP